MTNPATVSDLRLDSFEITVGRFRESVAGGFGGVDNTSRTSETVHEREKRGGATQI